MNGQEFKEKMKKAGFTQRSFAAACGITEQQISYICNDKAEVQDYMITLIEQKEMIESLKTLEITDIEQDHEEFDNCGAIRAKVQINGQFFDFFEYEIDGRLDRSADCAWNHNSDEELDEYLKERLGENADHLISVIYNRIDALIDANLSEDQINDRIKDFGYVVHGRDPYKNNLWHLCKYIDNGSATTTVGHFQTLKQVLNRCK